MSEIAVDTDPPEVEKTVEAENESVPIVSARGTREKLETVRLDVRDMQPSWPLAIASLEKLAGWGVLALRLGTLALIQQCVKELANERARADAIVRLRVLTDALAHMPLEV